MRKLRTPQISQSIQVYINHMLAYELLSLLVIICCWCSHALRNKDIWIVSVLHGNLEHAFPSPFPEFYLILVMYWHIYPLESTQGPLACFFSWNWTSRASIRSVEGDGMARERSIYRFQVFPPFITMCALHQVIHLLNFKCVIICSVEFTEVVVLYLWRIYCTSLRTFQWVKITWPKCLFTFISTFLQCWLIHPLWL